MAYDDSLDPHLAALLNELQLTPARDPQIAARARARFLAQAVSAGEERRHSMWTISRRKEQFAMNLIVSMLVVVTLLFGGGAAVSAAQDDLPNDPLYRVKLAREDASVWLASDPTLKIARLMGQAQVRAEEMAALTAAGIVPPAETSLRMQQQIDQAVQWAAMLDEAKMMAALQQVRTRLQTQEQLMSQIPDGTCAQCEPILRQTREMLQTQLGQVEDALADPGTFQIQERNQVRTTLTPAPTRSINTPQASCTPVLDGTGQRNGADDPPASTPEPPDDKGNGNGPSFGPGGGQGGGP